MLPPVHAPHPQAAVQRRAASGGGARLEYPASRAGPGSCDCWRRGGIRNSRARDRGRHRKPRPERGVSWAHRHPADWQRR